MYKSGSDIKLSASDLSRFMGCAHATSLDLQELRGEIARPKEYFDASLDALIKKGEQFEQDQLEQLQLLGRSIALIDKENSQNAAADTLAAMRAGVDIIYQARLEQGLWNGWADFMFRTDNPSDLGSWSYEVEDTKFAKHTKAAAILQVSLYSQMIKDLQGVQPEFMYIRTPEGRQTYRVDDYKAYFNLIRNKFLKAINEGTGTTYPEPVLQCDLCRWWLTCNTKRREDDHLSFIAGMGSAQRKEVKTWGIQTLKNMAEMPTPVPFKPSRGSVDTFNRLREQARLQFQSREQKKYLFELLPVQEEIGLCKLPEPSEGDIFFDFEGDPFVGTSGREYLFGWVYQDEYYCLWATTDEEEKNAFEKFMDTVDKIRTEYPSMHIYHFSQYEPSALKRLMGKYATKEDEVDTLLRGDVFVDLHTVTRHALRAGIESYSLKELEKLHAFTRVRELRTVGHYKALLEQMLESGAMDVVDEETKMVVQDYNKDDCDSTLSLRNWLEQLRSEEIKKGRVIKRPEPPNDEAAPHITDHQQRIQPLFDALMKDVPFDRGERNAEQQARWLLANMLDWYRREKKAFWWNVFRLRELTDEELLEEKEAISGLVFMNRTQNVAKSEVHYYEFPEQDSEIKRKSSVCFRDMSMGTVHEIDYNKRIVAIKKNNKNKSVHPTHIIKTDRIPDDAKEEAIIRFAQWVINNEIDGSGQYRAGRDLLLNIAPRLASTPAPTTNAQDKAVEWVKVLENGVLPIQGPPGTGKSFTAAKMIVSLLKAGKKVGITALGHKVIIALLEKVHDLTIKEKVQFDIVQKVTDLSGRSYPHWTEMTKYDEIVNAIKNGANIIAGTAFMWSRPEFFESVDVMFVDEAGQLSLIDTIALSHAGKNIVLLGDPQQLQQPQQGSHPEGTEVSALYHILNGHNTISEEKGVFLDKTWRLHPEICNYISELFYESRLLPMPQNENQNIKGSNRYPEPGIYIERVIHSGNTNDSPEEVQVVSAIVKHLLESGVTYTDSENREKELTADCIKIISPYNAQVNAILAALPGIQVGTVDKFQGQEAPVIIFSMATSSPEDAPRGMEFLYSLNRLNVAVSRARTLFILVANPALFEPGCRSPHQIKLANALCRIVEVAESKEQRAEIGEWAMGNRQRATGNDERTTSIFSCFPRE